MNSASMHFLIAALLTVSCASQQVSREAEHVQIVLLDSAWPPHAADRLRVAQIADDWMRESLHRPSSTFAVATLRTAGGELHSVLSERVPPAWGSGVMGRKAAFRESLIAAVTSDSTRPASSTLTLNADDRGSATLNVIGRAPLAGTYRERLPDPVARSEPLSLSVLCNRSPSTSQLACTTDRVTAEFDRWLSRAMVSPRSAFRLYAVGTSWQIVRVLQAVEPSAQPLAERFAQLVASRALLMQSFAGDHAGSAVAEALAVVARDFAERQGKRDLVVLSDLRQVSAGNWNFEHEVPLPSAFLAWIERSGYRADNMTQIQVRREGLHNRSTTTDYDAARALRLELLWFEVFKALGAQSIDIVRLGTL